MSGLDENHESRENGDGPPASKRLRASFPFSESELQLEFSHHQPGVARINNGSFGSCPASVMAAQSVWQWRFLQQPDDLFFNHLQPSILQSRRIIKDLIHADDVSKVSIVDNATTAAAIVLQQVARGFREGKFHKGDDIVILHYAYGAVKKSIHACVSRAGAYVIEVDLPFPVQFDDQIIHKFCRTLEKGKANGRRVCLSVLTQMALLPLLRRRPLLQEFLHVVPGFAAPRRFAQYGNGLAIESAWIGTRDYSSQLVVSSVMEFFARFEGGIDGISKTNHEAVLKMGQMLAHSWGTHLGILRMFQNRNGRFNRI